MEESADNQGESQSQVMGPDETNPGPGIAEVPIAPAAAPIAQTEIFQVDEAPTTTIPVGSPDNTHPDPVPATSGAQATTPDTKPDAIPSPVTSPSPLQSFPPNSGDTTTTTKDSNIKPTDTQTSTVPKPAALSSKIPTPAISKAPQPSSHAPSGEIPPANQPSLTPQQTRALQQTIASTQVQIRPPVNVSKAPTQSEKSRTPEPPAPKPMTPSEEPPKPQDLPKPTLTSQVPQAPKETSQIPPKPIQTQEKCPEGPPTPSAPPQKATPLPTTPAGGSNASTSTQREITLYFSYGSYYSQKVLLALYEKDLTFTPHVVRLDDNEQLEPWFIKLNPKAEVPVLKAGDKYVTESEVIINYIGRLPISAGNSLVGDSRSASGQTIQRFRRLLDGVNIPLLTYGLVHHPHLSKGTINIPSFRQQLMKERISGKLTVLAGLAETYPEHRTSYLALSETHAQKYETLTDEEAVKRELEQLGTVLSKVEEQLAKSMGSQDMTTSGSWLCCAEFTAADITLLVLLTRLHLLGLDVNYLQDDLPSLQSYYRRAVDRPSYQRLLKNTPGASSAVFPVLWYNSKKALPYVGGVTAVGALAGVAYWLYKKVT
ncbi:ganglioside-induced differentiation-associated protein 1-like [Liolophura sinensis]|uniref:ganglioside-induced differentiation-associated protein 1-like n=1 Tax=Liolophura sinensis TaxID=3198878 RepID=UPI00315897CA